MITDNNSKAALFLTIAAHELTVAARSTYIAGGAGVMDPPLLRRFNELQHRVTAAARDKLMAAPGFSIEDIIEMLKGFGAEFDMAAEMTGIIHSAAHRSGLGVTLFH